MHELGGRAAVGDGLVGAQEEIRTPEDEVHPLSRRAPWAELGYLRVIWRHRRP